jgi:S1-C subfamily serine protease
VGDVIREINHKPITTVEHYQQVIEELDSGDDLQLFIWRPNTGFLVIKLTK